MLPLFLWSSVLFLGLFLGPAHPEAGGAADARSPLVLRRPIEARAGEARSAETRAAEARWNQAAAQRERAFPHLLIAPSKSDARSKRSHAPRGNATWDPGRSLPPSVLSDQRRERALALLEARDTRERFELLRAFMGSPVEPETVRIAALRVDFLADTPGERSSGDGRFDLRAAEDSDALLDPPPHNRAYFEAHLEALTRYYHVMSSGSVVVDYDTFPAEDDSAYHLPDTFRYGPWIFSNSNPDVILHAIDLVGDALAFADTTDPSLDFNRYQSFVLFHAGPDFQSDIDGNTPWDIPSFNLFTPEPFALRDSTAFVNLVMVVPETVSQDQFQGALNGVVAHEFGHQLSFFDLYDVRNGLPVVGAFSLMDSGDNLFATLEDPENPGQLLAVRGTLPSSVDPWHKAIFFPEGVRLQSPSSFLAGDATSFETSLPAVEIANDLLYLPLNLAEYYLLENRRVDLNADSTVILKSDPETGVILGPEPDSTAVGDTLGYREYDYLVPGEGILVWHVDDRAINAGLSTPFGGINIFFDRPGVRVVEADGIRDIGTASPEFLGGPYDPYFLGGYPRLGSETAPPSVTNDGTPSGITISVTDSVRLTMELTVEMEQTPVGWPLLLIGEAGDEQILPLDLDQDLSQETLLAVDQSILAFRADGNPWRGVGQSALFALFPAKVEGGLAARPDFQYDPESAGPLVAAVSRGRLFMMDGQGTALAIWPEADSLVTSTPVVLESLVAVGCADGAIRFLAPDQGTPLRMEFDVASSAVEVLSVGRTQPDGPLWVHWAAQSGEIGGGELLVGLERSWSVEGNRPVLGQPKSLLAVEIPNEPLPQGIFAWEDGTLEWRYPGGDLRPGWPVKLPDRLAGAAILADADQDGVLETVVADQAGSLHVFGWNGVEEFGWPRSLWSEDQITRPPQRIGPRALDVNGDGVPEILLHRADGVVLAWDGQGQAIPGWPLSVGSTAVSGPDWIPAGRDHTTRLMVGNAYGEAGPGIPVTAISPLRVPEAQSDGEGFFPVSGVDIARSRVYPSAWVPEPKSAPGNLAEDSVRFYPNPLRGDLLTVRFILGRPAQILIEAYDLSGQKVANLEAEGAPGASGNQLTWDLASLAPGLYHMRFRARGSDFEQERFERVAIVR